MNWDYAVWAWQNLKTGDANDVEWDKIDKPYSEWRELKKKSPEQALAKLKNNPNLKSIEKGQALDLAYKWWADKARSNATSFWQAFEPNCYADGEIFGFSAEKTNYMLTDVWAKMNIFTGKCDWPDWRTEEGKAGSANWKADYLGKLEHRKSKR